MERGASGPHQEWPVFTHQAAILSGLGGVLWGFASSLLGKDTSRHPERREREPALPTTGLYSWAFSGVLLAFENLSVGAESFLGWALGPERETGDPWRLDTEWGRTTRA